MRAAALLVLAVGCGGQTPAASEVSPSRTPPTVDAAVRLAPIDVTKRLLALRGMPDATSMDAYIHPLESTGVRAPLRMELRTLRCAEPDLGEEPGAAMFAGRVPASAHHVVVTAWCPNDDSFHGHGRIVEPSRSVVWLLFDDDPANPWPLVVRWSAAKRN
jgi:hypothetical protein